LISVNRFVPDSAILGAMKPGLAIAACGWALVALAAAAAEPRPTGERRAELVRLVRQDCGSCHGMTMKGGLGPSLEPAALAEKDPGQMRFVILHGRRGTPMPPWSAFLTEAEAGWIVELLRKGLPDAR
jgi:cytochrome c55X